MDRFKKYPKFGMPMFVGLSYLSLDQNSSVAANVPTGIPGYTGFTGPNVTLLIFPLKILTAPRQLVMVRQQTPLPKTPEIVEEKELWRM